MLKTPVKFVQRLIRTAEGLVSSDIGKKRVGELIYLGQKQLSYA